MNLVDWDALRKAGFTLPDGADLPSLVGAAFTLLASPEATARDEWAYAALATWLTSGRLDEYLEDVGERASHLLAAPEVQARSFAALVLAEVLARDARVRRLGAASLRTWQGAWARWYVQERDLRDWVDGLGWLHALAHGADVAARLAQHPALTRVELLAVLATLTARLRDLPALPTQWEEDRLALAAFLLLRRPEVTPPDLTTWLGELEALWRPLSGRPRTVVAAFAVQVARSLLVFAHLGAQLPGEAPVAAPPAPVLQKPLLAALRSAFPVYPA
ncbi:DUF2785 domain-containing protein [Deinococcus terrestris]|nr:DUF2785 domain-containing protein [Deinococcus terrestris]